MKKIVLGISGGASFIVFLILPFLANYLGGKEPSQTAAGRWSERKDVSQVSCFFSVDSGITEDRLIEFEHTVDRALADASVSQESENPGARLWADAYSADGQVTVSSDKASIQADAVGIGGDFFLFHPLKLLYGSYFSGNDLMKDYCVIDEDAAWQLFGSSNVAGMMVSIGGVPHMVTGVVERPSGRLAEEAGLNGTLVYVSYQTLAELGMNYGINCYEIVMPNPVTGFAANYIREQLGMDEKGTEVVENTSRYTFISRLKRLLEFGTRSMNGKAIIYPYWENIARGYEDILALVTVFEILLFLYPAGLAATFFVIWWRHKGWTLKDVWLKGKDRIERIGEKARARRRKNKPGNFDFIGFLEETGDFSEPDGAAERGDADRKRKRKKSDTGRKAGASAGDGESGADKTEGQESQGEDISKEKKAKRLRFGKKTEKKQE